MDVADWLRALGFEHYESAFLGNDVSTDVLCECHRGRSQGLASPASAIGSAFGGHRRAADGGAPQAVRPTDDHPSISDQPHPGRLRLLVEWVGAAA